jgi:glycosyltransferase involved in cell wall biosynthesis
MLQESISMPRVSVIIVSFNHEKYITEAIRSVLDQTFQDFEIIIVDDASADGTVGKIKEFTDPRITLFASQKNQGTSLAANKCIEHARGEYLAHCGSCDVFLPDKLEKQVSFLDEHPDIGAVFAYAHIINETGSILPDVNSSYYNIFIQPNRSRDQWLNHFFYQGNCICGPSSLIRRKCFQDIGYYDVRFAELSDLDFLIRLCMKYKIHILPEKLIMFRAMIREADASGNRTLGRTRRRWEREQILTNFLSIRSADELCRIFPAVREFKAILEDDLISFFIATLALETNSPAHHRFAIDVLFDLLGNAVTAQKLEQQIGFALDDFIRLTGDLDLCEADMEDRERAELARLREMEGSVSWKVMSRCFRFIDEKVFPRHARRGRAYRKILERLK